MNARHNGVERADLICQDATAFLEEAASGEGFRHDGDVILMMDPPRAGSTPEFLQAAAKLAPKRIVYISCDPRTQARDVKLLCELGYSIEAVQPVDMFPHTDHIENIILLTC